MKSIPAKAGTHGENGHRPSPVWCNISTAGPRFLFSALSLTDALGQHQKITVRILDKHLPLTRLALARFAPDFARAEVDGPISGTELRQKRANFLKVNLKHGTLPERRLHRPGLESAMTLAEHELLPLRVFQINEPFFVAPESNLKAKNFLPKSEARVQVGDMKLSYHVGPAGLWRSISITTHDSSSIGLRVG
jgi:hypothetical protein